MALFGAKKTTTEDKEETVKTVKTVKDVKLTVKKTAKIDEKNVSDGSMKDLYSETASSLTKADKSKSANLKISQINKHILVRPLITEKATHLNEVNKYAFIVKLGANKILVAKEVAAVYNVKVASVNLIRMKGKKVSKGKIRGKRSDFKKAIVTLVKGQTIKLYEGV